jgi:hypothetical protein
MAVRTKATDYSTQWTTRVAGQAPSTPLRQPDDAGRVIYKSFDWTQVTAGDATSTAGLFKLPPGRYKFIGAYITTSAFGSSRTLDIGYGGYTDHTGASVSADPDAFLAAKDVSAALVGYNMNVATGRAVIDSKTEVEVYCTVAGGTFPAAGTLKGEFIIGVAI